MKVVNILNFCKRLLFADRTTKSKLEVIYLSYQLTHNFTILLLHPYTYFGIQNAIFRG
jgi:hypothetical protein